MSEIPQITSHLSFKDQLGRIRMRWGIGRSSYRVAPGLYALGNPGPQAEVLVTANYKLSFDLLRKELGGRNLWILVLDTRGINVWCAAGKGTFSSAQILRQLKLARLDTIVSHKRLIVPQLGAPGVSAHLVKEKSGFTVQYGPVRASDIPHYLDHGQKADVDMRRVTFPMGQRLAVVPIELVMMQKYVFLYITLIIAILALIGKLTWSAMMVLILPPLGAALAGAVLVPTLLPFIPVRSFALKGWLMGLIWAAGSALLFQFNLWSWLGALCLFPALSALLALNFTGASTFTSQSGVNREIARYARPMGIFALTGLIAFLLGTIL